MIGAPTDDSERFAFGRNWRRFVALVDVPRITAAEQSLRSMLGVDDLAGKTFLDIGCGSGLFSLAAHRLGAKVHSFDYDPDSVTATTELRARFGGDGASWTIEQGSVLDRGYLDRLGRHDVVYSWGVLHHTGSMWEALGNAASMVADQGALFIAIYNDQKLLSRLWTSVKRTYVRGPVGRAAVIATMVPAFALKSAARQLIAVASGGLAARGRGMAPVVDWLDWLGGYPFEVASPEAIVDVHAAAGFVLTKIRTVGHGHGCNEFVFRR